MGYSERVCQLCGISFNVGRIRKADEPEEAAFDSSGLGNGVIESDTVDCKAESCTNLPRTLPEHIYRDGSVSEAKEIEEHLAGPDCMATNGYSGHRISLEEMRGSRSVQCIMYKTEDWRPESGDEDFVRHSSNSFLTGISKGPPDEFDIHGLEPTRHGIDNTMIANCSDPDDEWGTPMHPSCFEIYKRLSLTHFGQIDIDGLRQLWSNTGDYQNRFVDFPSTPDANLVSEQMYEHVPGTEYLAANPVEIPGLDDLIGSCLYSTQDKSDVVFAAPNSDYDTGEDPFTALSPELKLMILLMLQRLDVANLRLASRSFRQLPQHYFRHLIRTQMPWVWEIDSLQPRHVDWYRLWHALSAADGGACADEKERTWLSKIRWHSGRQNEILIGLAEEEIEFYELQSLRNVDWTIDEGAAARLKELGEVRKAAGKQWPRATELKGLRNRRRIYWDVMEIIFRIQSMDESAGGTGEIA